MPRETSKTAVATPLDPEHRSRLLQAMVDCVAERGYAATTIADVVRAAAVSKRTFYEHFSCKEDCFLDLFRAASTSALRTLSGAVLPERPWQDQLEAALDAYFTHLSTGASLLRALFIDVHHLGDAGISVRREVMQQLADFMLETVNRPLRHGAEAPLLSPTMAVAAVGAINELVLLAIEQGRADRLTELTPAASALVLALSQAQPTAPTPSPARSRRPAHGA